MVLVQNTRHVQQPFALSYCKKNKNERVVNRKPLIQKRAWHTVQNQVWCLSHVEMTTTTTITSNSNHKQPHLHHTHVHVCTLTGMHPRACMCTQTPTHMCTHAYTHTHTLTHRVSWSNLRKVMGIGSAQAVAGFINSTSSCVTVQRTSSSCVPHLCLLDSLIHLAI